MIQKIHSIHLALVCRIDSAKVAKKEIMTDRPSLYKWYILTLSILTNMFVVAIPAMGMSVLAKEIAQDLHLSLVQVGIVWGIGSLPAIFISLFSGVVGDKVGPKRVLIVSSLLGGLLGAPSRQHGCQQRRQRREPPASPPHVPALHARQPKRDCRPPPTRSGQGPGGP